MLSVLYDYVPFLRAFMLNWRYFVTILINELLVQILINGLSGSIRIEGRNFWEYQRRNQNA
jgi:hypothetical protein